MTRQRGGTGRGGGRGRTSYKVHRRLCRWGCGHTHEGGTRGSLGGSGWGSPLRWAWQYRGGVAGHGTDRGRVGILSLAA